MKSNKILYYLKIFFFLSWLLIIFFPENLVVKSPSLPTDRGRVAIQHIPDFYNPSGSKLKVLHTDVSSPLRAGTSWIWEKQGQEEPESYYALMKSKVLMQFV